MISVVVEFDDFRGVLLLEKAHFCDHSSYGSGVGRSCKRMGTDEWTGCDVLLTLLRSE